MLKPSPLFSVRVFKSRLGSAFLALLTLAGATLAAPVHLIDESPVSIRRISPQVILVDFGLVSFGNLRLTPPANSDGKISVHFGETLQKGRIDRKPPGTVRYSIAQVHLLGDSPVLAAPPADKRNTQNTLPNTPPAVRTPPDWGVISPFRWVEIEGWPGELQPQQIIRKSAVASSWDDAAAGFQCSDRMINRVWDLCRYSIKATTYAGIYVDGDRERIPYEADAYLNQLSHYATSNDIQMARDTFDHLMKHPTWPTEWASHLIFMAYADYWQTGDTQWLAARYESLKPKLLLKRTRADGLVVSNQNQIRQGDLVDWPEHERDGFVMSPVNSVVNAFHLRSLAMMAELAQALGKQKEANDFTALHAAAHASFQRTFFDSAKGTYRDGEKTDHCSQHANLFPLAFGLVPEEHVPSTIRWVKQRGMACSVYAAQYLLEGLFTHGAETHALDLITAPTDRSWRHMVESGTTLTWEAWDQKYKPNQDWNHAWGAAPANLLPRYVIGARPLAPGWKQALIQPHPGKLESAEGKIPTPRGSIEVNWNNQQTFTISLKLPPSMTAKLDLPAAATTKGVYANDKAIPAHRVNSRWVLDHEVTGTLTLEVR